MKIIGHRGARGIELENSPASFRAALAFDIDAIEFDIHCTHDGELIVLHDDTTRRTAHNNVRIGNVTLRELRKLELKNGQTIPTLTEVLQLMGNRHIYIDLKDTGCADPLTKLLKAHPHVTASFVSFRPNELARIRELLPDAKTYLYFLKAHNPVARPFHMVRITRQINATGIAIDKLYLLNPLTYYLAHWHGLETAVYSVGSRWLTRLLLRLYPALDIITSHPEIVNHGTFQPK